MAKTAPCPYCGNQIPDSGIFGLELYTDVPENHKKDCPIREVMEVRLAQEDSYAQLRDNSTLDAEGLRQLANSLLELADAMG